MNWYLNYIRRWAIRLIIGRTEVCMNMTIYNGDVGYSGGKGCGAICENNKFVTLRDE